MRMLLSWRILCIRLRSGVWMFLRRLVMGVSGLRGRVVEMMVEEMEEAEV
jgi:hypothetical protein